MRTQGRSATARTARQLSSAFGSAPFDRSDAASIGISIGQLRAALARGLISRISRNVYVVAAGPEVPGPQGVLLAVSGLHDVRFAVAGRSGAEQHQLPFVRPVGVSDGRSGVEVLVHADDVARCGRLLNGAIIRPVAELPNDLEFINGVPVTSVLHTAIDVARMGIRPDRRIRPQALPLPEALVVLDAATARAGASTPAEAAVLLAQMRQRFWHCTGIRSVDHAMLHVDPLAESPLESWSRGHMAIFGVPTPLTQQEIRGADGVTYRVDFCWPQFKVIGEADGLGKYGDTPYEVHAAKRRELERQRALEAAGWTVVRWTWDELATDPQAVMRRIVAALQRAA